jgi:hypothetical protein
MPALTEWGEFICFIGVALALPALYYSMPMESRRYGPWLIIGEMVVIVGIILQLIGGHP